MRKMSVKMVLVMIVIIMSVTGFIGWIYYKDAEKITLDILKENHFSELKNIRDYYFDKLISDMEFIVETWSENPNIISYEKTLETPRVVTSVPDDFQDVANKWKGLTSSTRDITWIYYALESDGSIFISPVDPTMPADYDARQKDWYKGTVQQQGDIFWTEPYVDSGASKKILQTVSKAVYDQGKLKGVIGLDIELNKFTEIIKNLSFSKNSTLFLINENNDILAHNTEQTEFFRYGFLKSLSPYSGTELKFIDEQAYVVSWLPVDLNNWKLVAISKTQVFNDLASTRVKMAVTIAVALLFGVGFSYILVSELLLPLNELTALTQVVGNGNFDIRSKIHTKDEVAELSNSFNLMLDKIEELMKEQDDNYFHTVKALANAIEASDEYTRGHCDRVGHLSVKIAERLGLSHERIRHLEYACVLHDVGKIGIHESVLNKPAKLSQIEYEEIKQHPRIGYEIIKDIAFLQDASNILLQHHERIDGKGYPNRLQGEELLLESKILAAADTFDAMTGFRVYREVPLTDEEILTELTKAKGTQLDSEIVDLMIEVVELGGLKSH